MRRRHIARSSAAARPIRHPMDPSMRVFELAVSAIALVSALLLFLAR